jgi:hypothetical protein
MKSTFIMVDLCPFENLVVLIVFMPMTIPQQVGP